MNKVNLIDAVFRSKLLILCVFLGLCSPWAVSAEDGSEQQAQNLAKDLYVLFDQGRYAEMYDSFGSSMRSHITREQWIAAATRVAKETGKNLERKLRGFEKTLGAYRLTYDSQYETGKATDEIYIVQEDGNPKVAGIWVKPPK
jgi:Protein of unknown function (DUF4019)